MTAQTYTDAQIAEVVWLFIDRMNDIAPPIDSAERILTEFVAAVMPYIDKEIAERQAARCPYCDDTGDVHGIDGEWRGECTSCKSSQSARSVVVSDEDVTVAVKTFCAAPGFYEPDSVTGWKNMREAVRAALEHFAQSHGVAGATREEPDVILDFTQVARDGFPRVVMFKPMPHGKHSYVAMHGRAIGGTP